MKSVLALALVVLAGLAACGTRLKETPVVPVNEARAAVAAGALLLDVRTPEEFAEGHVEGAVNIPVQELPQRLGELGAKEREVVVYCRSGARSRRATEILKSAGHERVIDIGPMSAW